MGPGQVRSLQHHTVNGTQAYTSPQTTYYLRSSVLGGKTITEYDGGGVRQTSYSYLRGEVLSLRTQNSQGTASRYWQHINPVTGDAVTTAAGGGRSAATRLEPAGVNVGERDPLADAGSGGGGVGGGDAPLLGEGIGLRPIETGWGGGGSGAQGLRCQLDGIETECGSVSRLMDIGAAVFASTETFTRVRVTYADGSHQSFLGMANLPPGLDLTFTGYRAQAAARGFNIGSSVYGFSGGVNLAIFYGNNMQGNDGTRGGVYSFASSFVPQQSSSQQFQHARRRRRSKKKAKPVDSRSSCDKFAEELASRLYKSVVLFGGYNPDARHALGNEMNKQAYADVDLSGVRYTKGVYPIDGFRPELTANGQDADVYHHILFTAGNALHGTPAADAENALFRAYDWQQSVRGRPESDTELLDDDAGISVGVQMLNTALAGRSGDYWGLKAQIKSILCDH